ncbi:glycosyltransferase family 9 protein [Hyphobacterium sp. CCMP332]|nr:glycosyltransferase family 9 protein [Hyphobacterium sp. CCMP332]
MQKDLKRILIIQTAFIGDVILATPLIEALSEKFPDAKIDFILRKGNENLLRNHPELNEVIVWDKKRKYQSLFEVIKSVNKKGKYDLLINLQRFFTTGLMSALIHADLKIGFDKNPLSFFMDTRIKHDIGNSRHEVQRNFELLIPLGITDTDQFKVRLYPDEDDHVKVKDYLNDSYITISPASVWYTKQLTKEKWIELIISLPDEIGIYLLGGPDDRQICDEIISKVNRGNILSFAGQTSFLQTAVLMKHAVLNYTNDSAPMHIASSQNAKTCAVFCSTVPDFGFGPLSEFNRIVQVEGLECKPCGLHGFRACPKGHFRCAKDLEIKNLLNAYYDALNFNFE